MNQKAYLVKLTDAVGDVCAFLIDEYTSKYIDNNLAISISGAEAPDESKVLDGDVKSYERWYAKSKDINEIIKNAQDNGYVVDLNHEFNFVHY